MPHKKNPITCERIAGLARILRANAMVSMENMVLWHERDISHSSAERIILPDSTIALDYMLNKFIDIVSHLVVNKDKMLENLNKSRGSVCSGRLLVTLIDKGLTRNEAYDKIQRCAFNAKRDGAELKDAVLRDDGMRSVLSEEEIGEVFDIGYYMKNVDKIFRAAGI
jgi:adenylosuccinate lyase